MADDSLNLECNVSYNVNFLPLKLEVLSNEKVIATYENNQCIYDEYCTIEADVANKPESVEKKKLRIYYSATEYVDSNEFTVTKHYHVTEPIADYKVPDDQLETICDVKYEVNFYPTKIELISNGEVKRTYEGNFGIGYNGSYEIEADADNVEDNVEAKIYSIFSLCSIEIKF